MKLQSKKRSAVVIKYKQFQKNKKPDSESQNVSNRSKNGKRISYSDNSDSDLTLRISESENSDSEKTDKKSSGKKFEEVLIKSEFQEAFDNNIKIPDSSDKTTNGKEGEVQVVGSHEISHSFVSSAATSSAVVSTPSKSNRVFIIKNLSGKSVTLIPKSTPVVLNKDNAKIKPVVLKPEIINNSGLNKSVSCLNKKVVPNKDTVVLNTINVKSPKNLIPSLPNTQILKIADLNKSQKYFSQISTFPKIKTVLSPPQKIHLPKPVVPKPVKIIDLTEDREEMSKNATMPNFSKILAVLAESPTRTSVCKNVLDDPIPIYIDCQTQTENLVQSKEIGVQTELYMPSPTPTIEELPNITNLLEYVFNTPKYSSGLDEIKKSDLIDMSKNIVMKGHQSTQPTNTEEALKKQLFLDLKDCATFDFLGNKPIHNAVLENNLGSLKRQIFALRLRRIPLDIENNQGQTALQLAVLNNCKVEIISALLGNGASINIIDNEGNNLIHLAVINSTHFILEVLIKYITDLKKEVNRKNDEGLTPLMIASIDSKPEMVDMLLRNQADPNLRDEKSGRTALFHAVELNCNFVINLLLKYKADPKVRNFFGLTALDAAKDLDISDSKILEAEREASLQNNQASEVGCKVGNGSSSEGEAGPGGKRPRRRINYETAKKSKLSFVPSLMKVEMSEVKKANSGPRPRKFK